MRLAGQLHCTVEEAQERMSAQEFLKWQARDQFICPIGQEPFLLAQLCSMLQNTLRGEKDKSLSIWDFLGLPEPPPSEEALTAKRMKEVMAWKAAADRSAREKAKKGAQPSPPSEC